MHWNFVSAVVVMINSFFMNIIKELCLLHLKYWIICFGCCRFLPKYACLCVCLNLFFISLINNVWWGIVILRLYRCEIAQRNVNLKTSCFVYYREQWLFMYLICRLQNQRYGVLQTIVKFDFCWVLLSACRRNWYG